MKICFPNKRGEWNTSHSGKGKFVSRLFPELEKLGVKMTMDSEEKVDIDIQITRPIYYPDNATKRIIRRGPVKYDTNMTWEEHNHNEWKYMKQCHGVVYQSEFSKWMNDTFLGVPKGKTAVIFNGADPEYYRELTPYPSEFKFNYLASTREWVWEKRLKDIIESFILADVKESCLWIAGTIWDTPNRFPKFQKDFPKRYKRDNIKFLGLCDDETVGRLYRLCNAMIHIVYCDACPNAVAEALCAGCKVITNNAGGQKELVWPVTHDIIEDIPVPSQPWNRREQPRADRQKIAMKIRDYAFPRDDSWIKECGHVDIRNIAKQYRDFFEKVLYGDKNG